MLERLSNTFWGLGVQGLRLGKRVGMPAPVERAIVWTGRHVIPMPSRPLEIRLPFAQSFRVPPDFSRARSYAVGTYEKDVTELLQAAIKPGMTFVDIGAFCGYYTLLASRLVGETGHVYAFEPHPVNFGYLTLNVRANGCDNVTTVNAAVSDQVGQMDLVIDDEADHYWLRHRDGGSRAAIKVDTVTLDDFFAKEPSRRIEVMKIDIEGSEPAVFAGMQATSCANPALQAVVEYDIANLERSGYTHETFVEAAARLGFRRGFVIERGLAPFSVRGSFPRPGGTYDLLLKKADSA